jgi:TM2 domain-containing membrane protein YozV
MNENKNISEKRILPAFLLCFFFGSLGLHRFYVGKIGTGILWLVTLGFFGIGTLTQILRTVVLKSFCSLSH